MLHSSKSRLTSFLVAGLAATTFFAAAQAFAFEPSKTETKITAPTKAKLKMKDGRVLEGEIIAQTADIVRFKSKVSGIDVTNDYLMSDIAEIIKDVSNPAPAPDKADKADKKEESKDAVKTPEAKPDTKEETKVDAKSAVADTSPSTDNVNAHRVYFADLKGEFGRNITQTVIRKLTADARKENADTIIFSLDGAWNPDPQNPFQGWSQLLRFEEIAPALTDEIERDFPKPPRVATWVHQAMGGASLIPLCTKEIYMTDNAMIGGMAGLDYMMQGNRTVVEKQRSLRLQHAAGWVIKGGYDSHILYAMAVVDYVLSYRYVGDKVEYLERMPEGPHEILLTDAGPDTMADAVRGKGKAYLNITSQIGREIKVSKGTANSKEDLFFLMGLDRNRVDVGNAKKICDQWDRRIVQTEKELLKLWREDYNETRVQGNWSQRNAARGKRANALKQMLEKLNQKDMQEVFDDRYRYELRIPQDADLQSLIDRIDIERQMDKDKK